MTDCRNCEALAVQLNSMRAALEEVPREVACLSSQLPGFKGDCAYDGEPGDGPCKECIEAARLEGKYRSILAQPISAAERRVAAMQRVVEAAKRALDHSPDLRQDIEDQLRDALAALGQEGA